MSKYDGPDYDHLNDYQRRALKGIEGQQPAAPIAEPAANAKPEPVAKAAAKPAAKTVEPAVEKPRGPLKTTDVPKR